MTAYPKVVKVRVSRLDGDIHVSVFDEKTTVRVVKCFIDETVNIPCECQRLVAGNCEVTDDEILANIVGMRRRRVRHKITRVLDLTLVRLPNAEQERAHQLILQAIGTGGCTLHLRKDEIATAESPAQPSTAQHRV